MAQQIIEGYLDFTSRIDVTDEMGTIVISVPFGSIVTINAG